MALCWIVAAIGMNFTTYNFSDSTQTAGGYIAMVSIILFVFTFAAGIGMAPWAIVSEIYPLDVILNTISIAATANWVADY